MNATSRQLLILDGHNSYVINNVPHKARKVGLDLIILPLHTSHVNLQHFDVTCFKPFKMAFKTCKDVWTLTNKGKGVGKKDMAQ
jgi:hypothetical protein